MSKSLTARAHARARGALDGADAQALEGALSLTERERDLLRAEVERLTAERDRAIRYIARPTRPGRPAWARVRDALGVGSPTAHAMCRAAGVHPDTGEALP